MEYTDGFLLFVYAEIVYLEFDPDSVSLGTARAMIDNYLKNGMDFAYIVLTNGWIALRIHCYLFITVNAEARKPVSK